MILKNTAIREKEEQITKNILRFNLLEVQFLLCQLGTKLFPQQHQQHLQLQHPLQKPREKLYIRKNHLMKLRIKLINCLVVYHNLINFLVVPHLFIASGRFSLKLIEAKHISCTAKVLTHHNIQPQNMRSPSS